MVQYSISYNPPLIKVRASLQKIAVEVLKKNQTRSNALAHAF